MKADQTALGQTSMELWEPGRVELGFTSAVEAAQEAEALERTDSGMAALAVELGRAVDVASRAMDVRGVAVAAKELREVASRLRLDPTARGSVGDAFTDLLQELGTPGRSTMGHPGQT